MRIRLVILLCVAVLSSHAGNCIFTDRVKSLTSIVNGDWMNRPVMTLHSNDILQIGFDELSHNYHRLTYHIDHCEENWNVSEDIFESDWLMGFNDNQIEDYQNSINTTVLYTHYNLQIPNDRCQLKMSGNYRLTVYDEDSDNEKLLQVEFYVVEPVMSVGLEVSTNTDIDHHKSHQQLSMTLTYNELHIINPSEELRTVVMQNWREDQARRNIKPSFITMNGLSWQHHRQLIFDAGNEFHKFEVLDVSHPTMGIDRISWDGEAYQVYPFTSTVRRNYLTDVDADGAFLIRNCNNSEIDYTCEYVWVNYTLQAPYVGDIYINGHWTTDQYKSNYRMTYDMESQTYHAGILQKQGYYSYQYLIGDGRLAPSEGNFWETENRYQALVYYKGAGERTWRLVGYRALVTR